MKKVKDITLGELYKDFEKCRILLDNKKEPCKVCILNKITKLGDCFLITLSSLFQQIDLNKRIDK